MHEVSHGMIHEDININEFPRYYYTRKTELAAACFYVIITTTVKGQTNYTLFYWHHFRRKSGERNHWRASNTANHYKTLFVSCVHAVLYRRGSVLVVHHPESGEIFWVLYSVVFKYPLNGLFYYITGQNYGINRRSAGLYYHRHTINKQRTGMLE